MFLSDLSHSKLAAQGRLIWAELGLGKTDFYQLNVEMSGPAYGGKKTRLRWTIMVA